MTRGPEAQIVRRVQAPPLPAPSPAARRAWLDAPLDAAQHRQLYDRAACLHAIERAPAPGGDRGGDDATARVVFWNAERLSRPDRAAAFLHAHAPDALLLAECDCGMARTGNRHTVAELAGTLGHGYAYAVEFVELTLGDPEERRQAADRQNTAGLHGGAVTAAGGVHRPALIRLGPADTWFLRGADDQRRIGGRIAVAGTLRLAGAREIVLAAAHLESNSSPDARARQMALLLAALDRYADGRAVLLGGDLNTCSITRPWQDTPEALRALETADPGRFRDPVAWEPLFEVAAGRGYGWPAANAPGVTTRTSALGPAGGRPAAKLDWFLTRGLEVLDPAILPAVDPADGTTALSDHEALSLRVRVA
jgi:endonuclease/exonuclease/phosphatase family metal-dependent hydrolase